MFSKIRSLPTWSQQLLLSVTSPCIEKNDRHPLVPRKLSTNITEPLASSKHDCAHVTALWTEVIRQVWAAKLLWVPHSSLKHLTPSLLPTWVLPITLALLYLWHPAFLSGYSFRLPVGDVPYSQRPSLLTRPCQLSPLHLWDYGLSFITAFPAELMPLWTLGLPSAGQNAQEVHSECLLSRGPVRFPIRAVCVRWKGVRMNLWLSGIYQWLIVDISNDQSTWKPQLNPESLSLAIMVLIQVYSLGSKWFIW